MSIEDDFATWAELLRELNEVSPDDWSRVFKTATPPRFDEYEHEDAVANARDEFYVVAGEWCIGELCLDFPHSMHGDGRYVSVFTLGRNKYLLDLQASYEVEQPSCLVVHARNYDELRKQAEDLLFGDAEMGQLQNLDKKSEYDPDTNTTYSGEAELRRQWKWINS